MTGDVIFQPEVEKQKRWSFTISMKDGAERVIEGTGLSVIDEAVLITDVDQYVACVPVGELHSIFPGEVKLVP